MHGVLQLQGRARDNQKPWKGQYAVDRIPFLDVLLSCKFLPWSKYSLACCILSKSHIEILKRLFQSRQRPAYKYTSQKSLKCLVTN